MKPKKVYKRDVEAYQMGAPGFQHSPFDDARDVVAPLDDWLRRVMGGIDGC